ncbi:hypothetical protein ACFFWC_26225 [Plantactinospora siamensis]|uniref:Uncharacterized protein n=1 Tax=Plantactinospora siamensis TaxID=555372 RepID=A0ABV6P618_9ACTN
MADDDHVSVVTPALRKEAGKWGGMGNDMGTVKRSAAALTLWQSAFYVAEPTGFTVAPHSNAYNDIQGFMVSVLGGGETEFHQLDGALIRAADSYESADHGASADLNKIYSVPPIPAAGSGGADLRGGGGHAPDLKGEGASRPARPPDGSEYEESLS